MKKIKKVALILLIMTISMLSCGCGVVNGTSMNEEGKGTVSFKIGFKKGSIEDTEYTHFDSINDLATKLQEIIDDETGLKVTTDTTSSEKDDYIVVSYDYDNLEEYKANIDIVIQKYNLMVVGDDINGMFGYNPFDMNTTNKWECEALAEYLQEQGISADPEDRNVRKFIKLLIDEMAMCCENEYEEDYGTDEESYMEYMDEEMRARANTKVTKNKDDGETWDAMQEEAEDSADTDFVIYPDVDIIERGGEKYLKIKTMAMGYIEMYIRKLLEKNQDVIFDTEYAKESSYTINGNETKEIFKRTFANVDLASAIKKCLNEKLGEDNSKYSMKDFSPVLIVKLLNEEYVKTLNMEYNLELNTLQKIKDEEEYSMGVDIVEELYNERDTKYEMTFGENTAIVDMDNMYDYMDEDSYFTLSSKKGAGLEIKEHNNVAYDDLDEVPEAGDKENIVIFVIIAAIMFIVMVVVTIIIIKQWTLKTRR